MGYIQHHAIIVTGNIEEHIKEAHEKAKSIFDYVSEISTPLVNGYVSFYIPPDGGKERMEASNIGDKRREEFVNYLKKQSFLEWVEVQYGDDCYMTMIINDSDMDMR